MSEYCLRDNLDGAASQGDIPSTGSYGDSTVPSAFPPSPKPCVSQLIMGTRGGAKEQVTYGKLSQSLGTHLPGATSHSTTKPRHFFLSARKMTKAEGKGGHLTVGSGLGRPCTLGNYQGDIASHSWI